jgi:hypothetical protein
VLISPRSTPLLASGPAANASLPRQQSLRHLGFSAILLLAGWLLFCLGAQAQYTVGRVEGTVLDPTGAVVAGAKVTLRSADTNATRTFVTGRDGLYVFFAIPPGKYELTGEAPRFARRAVEIAVVTNQTVAQNLTLSLLQETTTVEVVGTAVGLLDTTQSQLSTTRTETEVANLPGLGHNMMTLVHLAPGVAPTNNPRGGSTFGGGGSYVIILGVQSGLIAANGGRARAASVQLDYTDANDWEGGGFAPGMQAITPDMLQEFKVLTGNFSAEYGVKSNAEIVMVTKSGGNSLHGTAYDFLQNDLFNARDYFDTTGKPSPVKQNIYGFTLGGPVVKDRTFFFGGYEGRRTRGASFTSVASLPTESARARATNPVIAELMDRYLPLPTQATANPDIGKLAVQIPSPVDNYQFLVKADHRFSQAHSFSARYLQGTASFVARFPAQNSLRGFNVDNRFEQRNVNLSDTYVLSPRTVNELRLGYGYTSAQGRPESGVDTPRFIIAGVVNFGSLNLVPSGRIFNVYQVNELLSHVRGAHVIKMGGDLRKIQDNSLSAVNSRGIFTFASLNSFLAGQPSQWLQLFGNTRRGFRTGLYGFFLQDDWRIRPTLTLNLGFRWEIQGALSEAHGLSSVLDPDTPGSIGAAGSGPLGTFRVGGNAVERNPKNVAPRLGFAWNPRGGDFVVRGGYGIFWDSFTFAPLTASRSAPPLNYTFTLAGSQISGANSFDNLVAGTAPIIAQANAQIGGFGSLQNFGSITTLKPNLRNPYVQDFSLGVEYRLADSYVFSLGYVGTKGTHLTRLVPINPVVRGPAPASSPADETARLAEFGAASAAANGAGNTRLDPRFDQVSLHDDGGSSIYHSLQATARKSFGNGLQFQASYTWSKSIDDASDFVPTIQTSDNGYAQNGSNLGAERAVSNYDIPHRFILTGMWQIPFFRDQKGMAGKILGGWSFQSVNYWQSGLPATLLAGSRYGIADLNLDGNFIPTGLDNTRADCNPGGAGFVLGNPATIPAASARGISGSSNSSNFRYTQPLLGNNGSCGRNNIRMNSLTNFDWSFFKDTRLAENGPLGSGPWNLQFRAEIYNIFNVPFLTASGDAWRTLSSPSFGLYNAAAATRRVQFALRLGW